MKVGGLYKFRYVYSGSRLNGRIALYMGKDYIHRDDGITIRNHKVLMVGASAPAIIDQSLLQYMDAVLK
jgi:hypothetical protein